jgi:2'-5' RNA ligase
MRCFIAINLPNEFQKEVEKIQKQLPSFIEKKTKSEKLHLTLKFLGEINKERIELVKNELRKIKFKKFITEAGEIGFFDNNLRGVVWIHLKNCEELQKQVDESLKNLFPKEKRFMGHLTIARVKSINNKKEFLESLKKIQILPIKFEVNNFCLMESVLKSEGPEYKIIEEYKLI